MPSPILLLPSLLAAPAHAAEVTWDGHYRARGLLYDSLSLSTENPLAEGASAGFDHRLRLAPIFHVTGDVAVHTQLDLLPLAQWGTPADTWVDPVTGDAIALATADGVAVPAGEDAAAWATNLQSVRAWAEVSTLVGRFRFGRMPLEWGEGVLLNAGLDPEDEYGDTADRVQFSSQVGPVRLMLAWQALHEGFLNAPDDMHVFDFALGYQDATYALGVLSRGRFQPEEEFRSYTGDLWARADLGPIRVATEWVLVAGSGNLDTGANDVSLLSGGGIFRAEVLPRGNGDELFALDNVLGGLELGWASGDKTPDDSRLSTFTFDRDYNLGLFLFEEPMPVLAAAVPNDANGGRETGAVRTGNAVSNAIYLHPWVGYRTPWRLEARLDLISARAASLPADEEETRGYGTEVDLTFDWTPKEAFVLRGTAGFFLPGEWYNTYEDAELGGDFDQPAVGAGLWGIVRF